MLNEKRNLDGVAKSPIYGVVTFLLILDISYVLSSPYKKIMPCISKFYASPSVILGYQDPLPLRD